MEIRTDILGKTPKIGDTAAWNPAGIKGLVYGTVIGFKKKSGLPLIQIDDSFTDYYGQRELGEEWRTYVPKTGFAILNS